MPCWHLALYDDFAWFYNRYWNEEFHSLAFPILERIWLPRLPRKGRILDVCCGTGYLAGLLTARGYRVTGIDASAEMIAHARENVPAARLPGGRRQPVPRARQVRWRGLHLRQPQPHPERGGPASARSQRTAAALKPGAPFAFDMLLESAYQTNWTDAFSLVRDDHVLVLSGSGFDFRTRLAQCRITMFRLLDGVWRRSDVEVHERCYTTKEIDAALSRRGSSRPSATMRATWA